MAAFLAALCWLWFFHGTLGWIFRVLGQRSSLNPVLILCAAGVAIFVARLHTQEGRAAMYDRLREGPRRAPWALVFAFVMALGSLVSHHLADVRTLDAALFAVGSFALLRLYLPPAVFVRGAPLLFLLLLLLPIQDHLDAFVGFPLRVATARSVQELFALLHIRASSAETILVLEGGIANVDLPCSGVKSLWSGAIFYFAATWLLRRRIGIAWLLGGAVYALLLLCMNALRVFILIVLLCVAQQSALAHSLHVPLGILGFVGSCAVAVLLLRRFPSTQNSAESLCKNEKPAAQQNRALFLFAAGLLVLSLFLPRSAPRPAPAPPSFAALKLPGDIALSDLPLSTAEESLFFQHGGVMAHKWRFVQGARTGSLLLVTSRSFRAHHPPEVCLTASGLRVDGMARAHITQAQDAPFWTRQLRIDAGSRTAFYWFQSRDRTTDSLLTRTLDDLGMKRRPWVLVSVLFDSPQDADDVALQGFLSSLHAAVSASLQGAS